MSFYNGHLYVCVHMADEESHGAIYRNTLGIRAHIIRELLGPSARRHKPLPLVDESEQIV